MKDYYQTRYQNCYEIKDRKSLVCHSKSSYYNSFRNLGYQFMQDVCVPISATQYIVDLWRKHKKGYVNYEPGSSTMVRSILDVHKLMDPYFLLEPYLGIIKSILGGAFYIHQSRVNYKHGVNTSGWSIHSDFETWHSQDGMPNMNCLTLMISVTDNTEDNGPLVVLPGTHKKYISCPKIGALDSDSEFSNQTEGVPTKYFVNQVKELEDTPLIMDAGKSVIFDCNLLHYSLPNYTKHPRTNLYFVLNSMKNIPHKRNMKRPSPMANLPEKPYIYN